MCGRVKACREHAESISSDIVPLCGLEVGAMPHQPCLRRARCLPSRLTAWGGWGGGGGHFVPPALPSECGWSVAGTAAVLPPSAPRLAPSTHLSKHLGICNHVQIQTLARFKTSGENHHKTAHELCEVPSWRSLEPLVELRRGLLSFLAKCCTFPGLQLLWSIRVAMVCRRLETQRRVQLHSSETERCLPFLSRDFTHLRMSIRDWIWGLPVYAALPPPKLTAARLAKSVASSSRRNFLFQLALSYLTVRAL